MAAVDGRRARFVEEYLIDLNGSRAAVAAGYAVSSSRVQACNLLANPEVQEELAVAMAERSKRTQITADRVLTELGAMALYDPAAIASHPMEGPADIATLPEMVRRAIVGWGWDKDGHFILKLSPKTPSLELIGRHLGMFKEKVELSGKDGAPLFPSLDVKIARG